MRVGIIGTGFMGRTHAAAWLNTPAKLVGFVGQRPSAATALAAEFGGRPFDDLAALLPAVDVLDICTPTPLHHPMTLQAAAAGVHVICEKPLARTVAQGEEMLTACAAAGVRLLVGHVVRFFPQYAQARERIASGELGSPAVLRLTRGTFQPRKAGDNWFLDEAQSGGMILDLMIHDFDYARWVAGDVATVYAQSIRRRRPEAPVDHGLVILTHRSGALSHVEGSWAYPPPLFRTRLEIAAANGWIHYDSDATAAIIRHEVAAAADTAEIPLPSSPMHEDPHTTQLRSFHNHLAHGTPTAVTAADGLAALRIALAAIESAERGEPVRLE